MLTTRMSEMTKGIFEKSMYEPPKSIEYKGEYCFLPEVIADAHRLSDYINSQPIAFAENARLIGQIKFDGSVPSDVFTRTGHKFFGQLYGYYYNRPIDNLVTFEWQHSTANFSNIIEHGFEGVLQRIERSKKLHEGQKEECEFLEAEEVLTRGIIKRATDCAAYVRKLSETEENSERKKELYTLSTALERVPLHSAQSFYEAVLCVYFCFDFLPDSLGTLDRYLLKYYNSDIENGVIDREYACELLQELFLRIQSRYSREDNRFYRGGESHFAIGGYTKEHEDGFNDLSRLIVEALLQLPIFMPQISLRWTKKTPREVFKFMLDCERHDKHKRIAFVNDEPRIKGFMENLGISFEEAINYTMVGCNEPAFQGGIWFGGEAVNIAKSIETTMHKRTDDIVKCESFDEFYKIYEQELFADLAVILDYADKFNYGRSKDNNILSSLLLDGCIENARSVTRGGAKAVTGFNAMGIVCVIDSLSVVKQFVFEEKLVSMKQLTDALKANWQGYEALRAKILKHAKFFGNSEQLSDDIAARFSTSLHTYLTDKRNLFGFRYLVGSLTGYNQHYKWFGDKTKATPDGRFSGNAFMVGLGQSLGKDREGLTALLSSVSKCDPTGIMCGPFVCNINVDSAMIHNDDNFDKTVTLLETYFKQGGLHFQMNCVTREELVSAQKAPDEYKSLRVRVSGFSDFFNNLNCDIQNDIINRTEICK